MARARRKICQIENVEYYLCPAPEPFHARHMQLWQIMDEQSHLPANHVVGCIEDGSTWNPRLRVMVSPACPDEGTGWTKQEATDATILSNLSNPPLLRRNANGQSLLEKEKEVLYTVRHRLSFALPSLSV